MKEFTQYLAQFLKLETPAIEALISLFREEKLTKKQYLAKRGEYSKKFAFVQSGILRAFYQSNNGTEYNKTFFCENNFVGAYSSLITGEKNLIDIQCITDCHLLVGDYKSFTQLYHTFPALESFARIMAERFFVSKEKREVELATLEAKDRYRIFQLEHAGLEQRIPQYHIASYLGITPTQLSRIRAQK